MLAHRAHLTLEGRRDVDDMVNVIAHDQEDLTNPVGSEPVTTVCRVEQGAWRPGVAGLDDRQTHGAMVGVKLRLPVGPRRTGRE